MNRLVAMAMIIGGALLVFSGGYTAVSIANKYVISSTAAGELAYAALDERPSGPQPQPEPEPEPDDEDDKWSLIIVTQQNCGACNTVKTTWNRYEECRDIMVLEKRNGRYWGKDGKLKGWELKWDNPKDREKILAGWRAPSYVPTFLLLAPNTSKPYDTLVTSRPQSVASWVNKKIEEYQDIKSLTQATPESE